MSLPNEVKQLKEFGRKEILLSVAKSPQASRVYLGASDGKVYVIDIAAEKPEFQEWAGHSSYVTGVVLAGKWLVSGSYDGKMIWRDAASGEVAHEVEAHQRWIRRLAATQDGRWVASVADDMVCRLWDSEGKLVRELKGHVLKTPHHFPSMLYACGFSADGAFLATADRVGHVVVWDVASGNQVAAIETPVMYTWDAKERIHAIGGPRSVAFSPDGKKLAVGGMGQVGNIDHLGGKSRVEVFDWGKGERTHEFQNDQFKGLVEKLQFDATGEWLLGVGGDNGGFVQIFDLAGNRVHKQEKAPTHIHDAVLDEAAHQFVAASHGRLLLWQVE